MVSWLPVGPGTSFGFLCFDGSRRVLVRVLFPLLGFWVERTPVHEAAQRGESLQLQQLIASGACVNQVTVDSITPLHAASLQGQAQCVQLLLAAGAQVGDHSALSATYWQPWGLVGQAQENTREKTLKSARI